MSIPNDPIILLSFINTQLRDNYNSLDDLCQSLNANKADIINKLSALDYTYDSIQNKFI